jgi:signal transduction histidine kinase
MDHRPLTRTAARTIHARLPPPAPPATGRDGDGGDASIPDGKKRERVLLRATFLADASRLLASLDIVQALDAVAHHAVPLLGACCAVDLLQDKGRRRLLTVGEIPDAGRVPEAHPHARAGHSVIFSSRSLSCMSVPLIGRGAVAGVFTFVASPAHRYKRPDLDLPEELARRAAGAIDNASQYQAARDALAGREQLLSVAAHEIRGPLTSLHLAVQGLLRGSLSSSAARMALEVIEQEDRRLSRFVGDLLDLGRIQTGQLHVRIEDVNLGPLVRDVVAHYRAELARAGSTVRIDTDGHLVGRWDRVRLEQVVGNLLSNAIKYGKGAPIAVRVRRCGEHAILTVADGGIGIPEAMLGKIFEPYERAPDVRHYGGLGLGLHIAKTVVDQLGGAITVDSRPGAGATFTVNLPISRSAADDQTHHPGGG